MKIDAFALNDDETSEHLATFELPDLDEISSNDIATKEDTTKPKVSLSFELSRSNIIKINKVNVSMEETKIETERVKKEKKESSDDEEQESQQEEASTDEAAAEADENAEKQEQSEEETIEKEAEAEATEEESADNDAAEEVAEEVEKEEQDYETIEKSVKVPHTFPCDVNDIYHGLPVLSAE
mmetsp:Transcript_5138/g.3583  ORF Transcript_5138/g.3583 Transcript_5138/m.3583 type:complete len:183 (+) Transcript_5138:1557-2105(+)